MCSLCITAMVRRRIHLTMSKSRRNYQIFEADGGFWWNHVWTSVSRWLVRVVMLLHIPSSGRLSHNFIQRLKHGMDAVYKLGRILFASQTKCRIFISRWAFSTKPVFLNNSTSDINNENVQWYFNQLYISSCHRPLNLAKHDPDIYFIKLSACTME